VLEFLHLHLHVLFKGLLALVDDVLSLIHTESEVLPFLIDIEEHELVVLGQLELSSADIRVVVVHDELELLLDWVDFTLELRAPVVNLLPFVLVLLELIPEKARLGEFLNGVLELIDEVFKLALRLLD